MRHNVGDVILLWQHINRLPHRCGHVFADRVHIVLGRLRLKHLIIRDFEGAKEHLLDFARVI